MAKTTKYWFPVKRYGIGWGFPLCWQGWLTLVLYITSVIGMSKVVPASVDFVKWLFAFLFLSVLFVAVCWVKGDGPVKWRWGE